MFYYTTTQVGTEPILKAEMNRLFPMLRPAFSRPGFITFKDSDPPQNPFKRLSEIRQRSLFARTIGLTLGQIKTDSLEQITEEFWRIVLDGDDSIPEKKHTEYLHCFSRDTRLVGENGFEPFPTEEDRTLFQHLKTHSPSGSNISSIASFATGHFETPATFGSLILNCIKVDPDVYWVGLHRVEDHHGRFAGGMMLREKPGDMISRAWLKFEEAIRWSDFPIHCGSRCIDIGSAPGGASQALLARGGRVFGVDPGEMDQRVLLFPTFTHLRGRIGQLKRRLFHKHRFAIADMNVAPSFTLDVLEDLTLHPEISLKGLLFTLKLPQWELVKEIPNFLDQIRSWGFTDVKARQLVFNRQEITIAALK